MDTYTSKIWGCFLGGAIGDALGVYNEFQDFYGSSFERISDFKSGGVHGVPAGTWSDDTSLSLCAMESLAESHEYNDFNPYGVMEKFCKWYYKGYLSCTGRCFDIGIATKKAIVRFNNTRKIFGVNEEEPASGNGSLMRIAPFSIFFMKSNNFDIIIEKASRLTHGSKMAIDTCKVFSYYLKAIMDGVPKSEIEKPYFKTMDSIWEKREIHDKVMAIIGGGWRNGVSMYNVTPFCIDTLCVVLYEFFTKDSFEDGMISIINRGGDTDTLGAIYGNLAGCYYGIENIPKRWFLSLRKRAVIIDTTAKFITSFDQNRY